jgi:hypothetical protein
VGGKAFFVLSLRENQKMEKEKLGKSSLDLTGSYRPADESIPGKKHGRPERAGD